MPLAKIHVLEGRYDEQRLANVSTAVQEALISVLKIPSDDFFQVIHELPRNRFLHTPSFLGMKYSDDFIVLEVAFISGRPAERNSPRVAQGIERANRRTCRNIAGRPHDPTRRGSRRELFFRSGLAQRAFISQAA